MQSKMNAKDKLLVVVVSALTLGVIWICFVGAQEIVIETGRAITHDCK